jgi:chemotaxis signal transduction protein
MVQVSLFSTGGLRCALPLAGIQSVIPMMAMEPPPDTRRELAGTINLHGRIVPVYSLRELLGMPDRSPRISDMLLIVETNGETLGIWIDQIHSVEELTIPSSPEIAGENGAILIQGITLTPEGMVFITDITAFLTHPPDETVLQKIMELRTDGASALSSVQGEEIPDPDTVQKILAERALKMLPAEPGFLESEMTEVLRFQLAYRQYALEMKFVREVIITGEITPVPGTPDFISGICAVRGQIISLVDLRALLKIPEKGLTDLNRVIVMTNGKNTFGILADSISGVGIISLDQVTPPRPGDLPDGCKYLRGTFGEDNLYILDAGTILGDPGIIVDEI